MHGAQGTAAADNRRLTCCVAVASVLRRIVVGKCHISLAFLLALAACGHAQVDEKKSDTRYDLAVDFLRNGNLDSAEQEAKKAIEYNPNNALAFNVMGLVALLRAVNNLSLLEVTDCLTGIDAEALRSDMETGLESADKRFGRATEIDGEYGEAYANRGVVALNLDDYKRAVGLFDKALQHPTRLNNASLTRANLGWAHFQLGDMVAAAKELRQAAQFQPGMCLSSYRLGRVYFAREEWDKALEKFREVAAQPQCPIQEAHLYLAKTYLQVGMAAEVPGAIASCVKLAPKSCLAAQCKALHADAMRSAEGAP